MMQEWTSVVEKPFPTAKKVTQRMIDAATAQGRKMRGSVRLMSGRLSTTDQLEERRRQARRPL